MWELFRPVVPPTVVQRPQGGGRRRAGNREVLAAIVFVATSGRTWRQLPPVFGARWHTVYRRFAQWSRDRTRPPACGADVAGGLDGTLHDGAPPDRSAAPWTARPRTSASEAPAALGENPVPGPPRWVWSGD
ncbi:transposase [Streptomyces collinus]